MSAISDEEYVYLLSIDERAVLGQFKTHKITEGLSNRKLMLFLFARKLNVDRAVTLLTKNLAFRKQHGLGVDVKREEVNEEILRSQVALLVPEKRDKEGRGINYFHPSRLVPGDYPLSEFFKLMMYLSDLSQYESPDYHRKGIVLIEDFNDAKFKNFDKRILRKSTGLATMEDIFPGRIQAIYLLNPPVILKALIKLGKFLVKQKILNRIHVLAGKSNLLEYVDADQLHEDYGGRLKYTLA